MPALPFGLAETCTARPANRFAFMRQPPASGIPEQTAALVVRLRWLVVILWTIVGTIGIVRAKRTPELLNVRGGAIHETEAARADRWLATRFERPFSEFFAVVLESHRPFTAAMPRAALDSIIADLRAEPYVRSLLSYPSTNDSLFLSSDRLRTFLLVSVDAPK